VEERTDRILATSKALEGRRTAVKEVEEQLTMITQALAFHSTLISTQIGSRNRQIGKEGHLNAI